MNCLEALNRFDNLEERCINTISNEVAGEENTKLSERAVSFFKDPNIYSGNTAVIAIIYKNSKYTKTLDYRLNGVTNKVGNAYVLNIANSPIKKINLLFKQRVSKLLTSTKDKSIVNDKLKADYNKYMTEVVKYLSKIDIYGYIPDKNNIEYIHIVELY